MRNGTALINGGASALLFFGAAAHALAATIVGSGSQLNVGDGLRSTSVTKTNDINGDKVYGTDGTAFFAAEPFTPVSQGTGGFLSGAYDTAYLPGYASLSAV